MRDAWLWTLLLGSAGLTLAAHRTDAWVVAGPPVIDRAPGPDLEARTSGVGAVRFDGGKAVLDTGACNEACRAALVLRPSLPAGSYRAVVPIARTGPLERARLFAVSRDAGGGLLSYVGGSAAEGGGCATIDLRSQGPAVTLELGVVAVGQGGVVSFDRLTVVPTRSHGSWWVLAALAAIGWTTLAAGSGLRVARALSGPRRPLVLGLGVAVLVGVLVPRPALEWLLGWVPGAATADLQATLWEDPSLPLVVQKVLGHGGAFVLLGWLSRSVGAGAGAAFVRLAGFAAATELVQLFRPGRSATITDVAMDLCGAAIGIAAWGVTRRSSRAGG